MFRQDSVTQNYVQLRFSNSKFKSYYYRVDAEFLIFSIINDDYSSCNEKSVSLDLSSIKDIIFHALKRLKLVYYSTNKILTEIEIRRENRFVLQNFLECLRNSILMLPKHDNLQNELLNKLNVSQVISPVVSTKITFQSSSNEKKVGYRMILENYYIVKEIYLNVIYRLIGLILLLMMPLSFNYPIIFPQMSTKLTVIPSKLSWL